MKSLEKIGVLEQDEDKGGRRITQSGQRDLDRELPFRCSFVSFRGPDQECRTTGKKRVERSCTRGKTLREGNHLESRADWMFSHRNRATNT